MSKHGEPLGVDLAVLYQSGKQLLPHLADQFQAAAGKLGPVGDDAKAWSRNPHLGIGANGCQSDFSAMVGIIVGHLKSTERNLDETGAALCHAATDYAETDGAAKKVFDEQKNTDVLDD